MLLEKIKKMQFADYIALFKITVSFIPGKILKLFKNDIWIISEREYDARDNGYWLFKYIRENHKEVNAYYPINFSSSDYLKIQQLGNVIKFGSLRHHIYLWACKKHISAHIGNGFPNGHICYNLLMWNVYSFKNVFLQHGITLNAPPFLYKENTNLNLLVCSAKRESAYVVNQFGYSDETVKCLGFCRYDNLDDSLYVNNQILIMPTWRCWLYTDQKKETSENLKVFLESEYYSQYKQLVENKELISLAEKNNLKIIFFLHNDMQQFASCFKKVSENVVIATRENYDVQALLKESSFLITDYSSISFDFAYMNKPMLYFQFDQEEFRLKQYPEGYFSYENDGFGPVVFDVNSVVTEITKSSENNFKNFEKYTSRINSFFTFNDKNNCERNFYAIRDL